MSDPDSMIQKISPLIRHRLGSLVRLVAVCGILLLIRGIWLMEIGLPPLITPALCVIGGVLIFQLSTSSLSPSMTSRDCDSATERRIRGTSARFIWGALSLLLGALGVNLIYRITPIFQSSAYIASQDIWHLWWYGVMLAIFSAWCLDRALRTCIRLSSFFNATDIALATVIFLVAFIVRRVGPVTGASDEFYHFAEMLSLRYQGTPPVAMSGTSYSFALHTLIYHICSVMDRFIDPFDVEKIISTLSAAVSVSSLYLLARIYAPRSTALTAAVFLCFMGWHWVNSRFIYTYPHDLAVISLGALFVVLSCESKSFLFAALAGLLMGTSLIFKKISASLIAFDALFYLAAILTTKAKDRSIILSLCSVALGTLLIVCAPISFHFYSAQMQGRQPFFEYLAYLEQRNQFLREARLPAVLGLIYPIAYGFQQLFFSAPLESIRHVLRIEKPLLDPILLVCFSIGIGFAIRTCLKRSDMRVALMGMVIFMLPMALALPHPIARRMLGVSFFAAWLGAVGAHQLCFQILPQRMRYAGLASICLASAAINIFFYSTVYLYQPDGNWEGANGLSRAEALRATRAAIREGSDVVFWVNQNTDLQGAVADLKNITFVKSVEELRAAVMKIIGKRGRVVVSRFDYPKTSSIKDLIPEAAWSPGNCLPHGPPMIYTADLPLP